MQFLTGFIDASSKTGADAAGVGDIQGLLRNAEIEFRAQIHGLLAMVERLERQPLGADAQAHVQSIRATGENLLRMADDARDTLQARSGPLDLQIGPHSVRLLMDQVQERWSARAAEAGVFLSISYDGDPDLSAEIDARRLTQVFDNLIDNALRYTRQGSVEAALRARSDNSLVVFEGRVRDTGPGLPPERLSSLFEGSEDGNLALFLTHRIVVDSMKGAIHADSNPGQGMTIGFEFSAAETVAVADAPASIRPLGGAPHVLVVDDNATNRMVAEALCEMFNCTSETAEDGLEAVEAVRSGRFDVILMDIRMPRMDGIAATKAIRAMDGALAGIPIIALTANVDPDDARSYLEAGMCCVVEKPIKPDRLLQAINLALAAAPEIDGQGGARTAAA